MGLLDPKDERNQVNLERIRKRLRRRGLEPDFSDWEVHGPHRDMNYQVFIGWANETTEKKSLLGGCFVAVYPRAIYRIEGPSDWPYLHLVLRPS